MSDSHHADVRQAIAEIPALSSCSGPIKRLGGLTNRVYQVGQYCVRLPGEGTEEYINRANESMMAHEAAKAGISPQVIHADPKTGVMVTDFIAGAVTMTPALFRQRTGSPGRAADAFRELHTSGAAFPVRFELFAMIDEYLEILAGKDVELPDGYHDAVAEAETVRQALAEQPAKLAPCHCDPLCENFLDTGDRMWIVDWEYSGMNDPLWDLGDLSVEGEFNDKQDAEMLLAYFGREPSSAETGRVVIYKAMCDLLWTLWGLIQLANKNPADDFRTYADTRFGRCITLMKTPTFSDHVEAIRKG